MERSKKERSGGGSGGRAKPEAPGRGESRQTGCVRPGCCGLSALTGMSGASVHLRRPLGQFPWKLTVFLIVTHIYAADPTSAEIPVAREVQTGRVKNSLNS